MLTNLIKAIGDILLNVNLKVNKHYWFFMINSCSRIKNGCLVTVQHRFPCEKTDRASILLLASKPMRRLSSASDWKLGCEIATFVWICVCVCKMPACYRADTWGFAINCLSCLSLSLSVQQRNMLSTSPCVLSQILLIIGVFSGYTLIWANVTHSLHSNQGHVGIAVKEENFTRVNEYFFSRQ